MRRFPAVACWILVGLSTTVTSAATPDNRLVADLGRFIVRCSFVRSDQIDPILAPGAPRSPHVHDFFGNGSVHANSIDPIQEVSGVGTMERRPDGRLRRTTCLDRMDTSSFWFPQLYFRGVPHQPSPYFARAYYSSVGGHPTVPFPDQLQMVNGFPGATGSQTGRGAVRSVSYDCGAGGGADGVHSTPDSTWPYDCTNPAYNSSGFQPDGVIAHVDFPWCWDRRTSETDPPGGGPGGIPQYLPAQVLPPGGTPVADVRFPDTGNTTCPAGDVEIPRISLRLHTGIRKPCGRVSYTECMPSDRVGGGTPGNILIGFATAGPEGTSIAGPYWTLHADYWETWREGTRRSLGTLVDLWEDCLAPLTAHRCGEAKDSRGYPE
jgi:hypothetical protein